MTVTRAWIFQRDILRKTYNREVLEFFRDVDDDLLDDINVARKAAKRACLMLPNETQGMAIIKMNTFYYICQRVQDKPSIVGISKDEYDGYVTYKPHVFLYFLQDSDAVPDGYQQVKGELSFRLVNETSTSITKGELTTLANRIKSEFGANNGYLWKKGNLNFSYVDKPHGISTKILSISQSEAQEVAQKLCKCANVTYLSDNLSKNEPGKSSQNTATNQIILGQSVKKARYRPTCQVRFQYAKCSIHGLPEPVVLYDATGRLITSLVF